MDGNFYGYNRVSSKEQHLDRGREKIQAFCQEHGYHLERIFEDKQTGRNFDRPRYIVLKEDVLRPGDTLIVPEYDRLGRSDQTKKELEYFAEKKIRVIFLDIPTTYMDFSTLNDGMAQMIMECVNRMLIEFYDCLARSELERKEKRQREGIKAMKERGDWERYGRPRCMSRAEFEKEYERVLSGEIGTLALQRELNLNRDTFFRYVREYKKLHNAVETS
jgi:DNA invertase Pin-like site-specific DNA recombinase